jgi:hypothetical protein
MHLGAAVAPSAAVAMHSVVEVTPLVVGTSAEAAGTPSAVEDTSVVVATGAADVTAEPQAQSSADQSASVLRWWT